MSAGPHAGLLTRTVPSTRLAAGERSYRPLHEDSNMAINATSAGAIRPKNTQVINADGSTRTINLVATPTAIKRVRRKLAQRNHQLVVTREGSQARIELGEYAVLDADRDVLTKDAELTSLARFLGVLSDNEMLEPPQEKAWRYFGVESVGIGESITYRRITPIYRSERKVRESLANLPANGRLQIVGERIEEHRDSPCIGRSVSIGGREVVHESH